MPVSRYSPDLSLHPMLGSNVMNPSLKAWACPWHDSESCLRDHRRHDKRPGANVSRRVVVSVVSETTCHTAKSSLIGSIAVVNMTAHRALFGGITRINDMQPNPIQFGLVGHKLAQLTKRPPVVPRSLCSSYRYPVTNTIEVFNGNVAPGVKSLLDQTLANDVVGVALEAALSSADGFQFTFSGFGADALEAGSHSLVMTTGSFHIVATENFAIGVNGQISNSKVYPQYVTAGGGRSFRYVDGRVQIESAVSINEIGLSAYPVNAIRLIVAVNNGDDLSTLQCQDANPVGGLPGEDTLVVDYCAVQIKSGLDRLIAFVSLNHFGNGPNRHLGRQTESLAYCMVNQFLQFDFVGQTMLESNLRDIVASCIELLHCFEQGLMLFGRRLKFDFERQLHVLNYTINRAISQVGKKVRQFHPRL